MPPSLPDHTVAGDNRLRATYLLSPALLRTASPVPGRPYTLVIAEQTTKTHVGRILAKLDLRDRAQAVVLASETGLVTAGGSGPARANTDTRPHL